MRNISWQTDFRRNVPYKQGDEMEFSWLFSGDAPRNIALDIAHIKDSLDIEHIFLDDTEIQESDLGRIHVQDASLLKITGKARKQSTEDNFQEPKIVVTPDTNTGKTTPIVAPIAATPLLQEPSNIEATETKYNSNINNLITFRGQSTESIEFVNIGEKRIQAVHASGALFVQVDRDTFSSGEYFVFFTLKNGKIITPDIRISFEHSDSLINIANITPKSLVNDADRFLVIQGNGFKKIISIQLNNNLILRNAEFQVISDQVAGVKIPKDLPPGEYYFNIMDTSSIYELKNMRFTITHS